VALANSTDLVPVQTIAIAGGKGGIGKSCVALLFDADFSHGNIDCLLKLAPEHNLSHVLSDDIALEEVIVDAGGGLKVLPSGNGAMNLARLSQIEHVGIIGLLFRKWFNRRRVELFASCSGSGVGGL